MAGKGRTLRELLAIIIHYNGDNVARRACRRVIQPASMRSLIRFHVDGSPVAGHADEEYRSAEAKTVRRMR